MLLSRNKVVLKEKLMDEIYHFGREFLSSSVKDRVTRFEVYLYTSLKLKKMRTNSPVSEIMTTKLVTVYEDTSIKELRMLFKENPIHHLPVIKKDRSVSGIISKEDLGNISYGLSLETSGKTYTKKTYANLTAKDIMTKDPMRLDAEDTIGLAADVFMANRFHALPIIDEEDKLVGIVTSHDLLKYAYNQIEAETEKLAIF